jgi:cytidine deaminase
MKQLTWLIATGLYSLALLRPISAQGEILEDNVKQSLVHQASEARLKAYAPYSRYLVGAAALTSDGKVFSGFNIENASYGLTCCAERVAIFKAISEGCQDIITIAVVTKDGGFPCGACRQVLNEFNPKMIVIVSDEAGRFIKETTLDALLPNAFGPQNLE